MLLVMYEMPDYSATVSFGQLIRAFYAIVSIRD
jgi:hypothetical protein